MIIYDVSRLISRLGVMTPTGIDRVDLRYFFHIYNSYPKSEYVFFYQGAFHVIPKKLLYKLFCDLRDSWATCNEKNIRITKSRFKLFKKRQKYLTRVKKHSYISNNFLKLIKTSNKVIYVNTSHSHLEKRDFFRQLNELNVEIFVTIHDLIPITHPHFCRAGEELRHENRLLTIFEYANFISTISNYTQNRIIEFATNNNIEGVYSSLYVNYLGAEVLPSNIAINEKNKVSLLEHINIAVRGKNQKELKDLESTPFFIMIGTIEPRKNHLFIFKLWQI